MPTYYATVLYNGTGSAVDFDYPPFDFISQADIEVFVGGTLQTVAVHYTHETGGSAVSGFYIKFVSAPPSGENNVKLRRKTTRGELDVDFVDGSTLTEETLDIAMKQGVYLAEEALDTATDAVITAQGIGATYTAGTLPGVTSQEDYSLQVDSTGSSWEVVSPALARTGLELGTAAVLNTGVGASNIPLNAAAGDVASLPLNRGAYLDWGSAIGKLAVHSENDVLRAAAYKDIWESGDASTDDKVVVMTAEGLPALNGHNLVDLQASIPICYITYAVAPVGGAVTTTTPASGEGGLTGIGYSDRTWEKYPLSAYADGDVATGISVAASVITIPRGKWRIRWWCQIHRCEEVQMRLRQTNDVAATLVIGQTQYSNNSHHGNPIFGCGRFSITGETSNTCELQFYAEDITSNSVFGRGMGGLNTESQVFANIEITKEAHT